MDQTDKILEQRGKTYGDFRNVAALSQELERTVKRAANYDKMPAHHKEATKMILQKISRLVNGDYNHLDSWDDIAGYARLVHGIAKKAAEEQKDVEHHNTYFGVDLGKNGDKTVFIEGGYRKGKLHIYGITEKDRGHFDQQV